MNKSNYELLEKPLRVKSPDGKILKPFYGITAAGRSIIVSDGDRYFSRVVSNEYEMPEVTLTLLVNQINEG